MFTGQKNHTGFGLVGVGAEIGQILDMDLSDQPWWMRFSINLIYLVSNVAIILLIRWTGVIL